MVDQERTGNRVIFLGCSHRMTPSVRQHWWMNDQKGIQPPIISKGFFGEPEFPLILAGSLEEQLN